MLFSSIASLNASVKIFSYTFSKVFKNRIFLPARQDPAEQVQALSLISPAYLRQCTILEQAQLFLHARQGTIDGNLQIDSITNIMWGPSLSSISMYTLWSFIPTGYLGFFRPTLFIGQAAWKLVFCSLRAFLVLLLSL